MESYARPPEQLTNKKPMDKTWRTWKQEFTIFMKAAGFDEKSSNEKACFLLNTIGKLGIEAMQDMIFDCEDDKQNYNVLLLKFDEHFDPPKNEVEERFKFYSRSRKNNESIDDYIADLKEKVKTCNFGHLTESLIRDKVIMDIKDQHLRKILFEEKNLDLSRLIITYKQFELNAKKMKDLGISEENKAPNVKPQESNASANQKSPKQICSKCGTSHAFRNCPAFKEICQKCNEIGHFTRKCKKNKSGTAAPNNNDSSKADVKKNVVKNCNNVFKDPKNPNDNDKKMK